MDSAQLSFLPPVSGERSGLSARQRAERVLRGFADLDAIRLVKPRACVHFDHEVHSNSLEALKAESGRLAARREEVYAVFEREGRPLTDREVLAATSYPEVNCVQPRITEMVKAGLLFEFGKTRCGVTGKNVRACAIAVDRGGSETEVFAAWKRVVEQGDGVSAGNA